MDSYEATSEVRFGVVLYGGVSLAIYINGVAQELYRMVRATAPDPSNPGALRWAATELRGTESIYRELACRLGDGRTLADASGATSVRTRLVVDLLSGASAGGINGVYLAKALANDADLSPLERLWIERGDFAKLLNDRPAAADLRKDGLRPGHTSSLLNSRWMYRQLLDAMRRVGAGRADAGPSPYADAIDLWISTTDLEGRVEVVDTTDTPAGRVVERSHRTLLHFAYADEGSTGGERRNDFTSEHDAMLAFAARATSSFPAAFEPMRLGDIDPVVDALYPPPAVRPHRSGDVEDFFPQYAQGDAVTHSFADGGYLDNKPFEQILRTLPLRRATLPVKRIVLYVEPDPGRPSLVAEGDAAPRPDLVGTVLGVVTTPRNETVGGDVAQIRTFGATTRARSTSWKELTLALDAELDRRCAAAPPGEVDLLDRLRTVPGDLSDAELDALGELLDQWSPTAAAHRTTRVAVVERDLAALLARTLPSTPQDERSELHQRMLHLVDRMRRDPPLSSSARLLQRFDTRFQMQRINFLQRRAVDLVLRPDALGVTGDPALSLTDAQRVRASLDAVFGTIRRRAREVRRPRSITAEHPCAAAIADVAEQFRVAGIELSPGAGGAYPSTDAIVRAYDDSPPLRAALQAFLAAVDAHVSLGTQVRDAWRAISDEQLAEGLRHELQRRWILYRFYDEIGRGFEQLPGESSDVDIYRVSPLDASALVPDLPTRYEKLAGGAVHHFGAFFAEPWRRNDVLWGRLDAAERIIDAVVASAAPETPTAARDDLVARAHRAILTEAWADLDTRRQVLAPIAGMSPTEAAATAALPDVLDPTRGTTRLATCPRTTEEPSPQQWMALTSRVLRVTNSVTTDVSVGALDVRPLTVHLARLLKLIANALEFVSGERLKTAVLRNLLVLLAMVGLVTGVVGTVTSTPSVSRTGWALLAGCLAVRVVADAVADRVGRRRSLVRYVLRVSTFVVLVAAVGGMIVLHQDIPGWRPLLYTGAPALVVLVVGLVTNRRVAPWKGALVALAGTLLCFAVYGIGHLDELRLIVQGKPVP